MESRWGKTTTQGGIAQHREFYTFSKLAFSFLPYGLNLVYFPHHFLFSFSLAWISERVCVHKHVWVWGGDKYWPFTLRFQAVITGKLLTANDELSSVCKYTEALWTSGPINRKVTEWWKYCNSVMEGIHLCIFFVFLRPVILVMMDWNYYSLSPMCKSNRLRNTWIYSTSPIDMTKYILFYKYGIHPPH